MKLKKSTKTAVNGEQNEGDIASDNGNDEKKNGTSATSSSLHLTDAEKEKGNFQHFNISKKTIQKLKSNSQEDRRAS